MPMVLARRLILRAFLTTCMTNGLGQAQLNVPDRPIDPPKASERLKGDSPQDALSRSLGPLNLVRDSVSNWSEAELAALDISISRAAESCESFDKRDQYTDEDLLDLAKLCRFGQKWQQASSASARYVSGTMRAHASEAYALLIDSYLHTDDTKKMIEAATSMLEKLPYDGILQRAANSALDYLEVKAPESALDLARLRQPLLLAKLADATYLPGAADEMYASGLYLPRLEQYLGSTSAAKKSIEALDETLDRRKTLTNKEQRGLEASRRQSALIGAPFPQISLSRTLLDKERKPRINFRSGDATILLVFPDWCPQCIRMAQRLGETMQRLNQRSINVYGILIESGELLPSNHSKTPSADLTGTPTLVTTSAAAMELAISEFPFAIVLDRQGNIRFAQMVPENALDPDGALEQVAFHVAKTWNK